MPTESTIELDACLALVLDVGLPHPLPTWRRAEWRDFEREMRSIKDKARDRGTVPVSPRQLALAVARFGGLNDPTHAATVDVLVALVASINRVMQGSRRAFLGAGLQLFGWPSDPDDRIVEHLLAAADLGLFDPSDCEDGRPVHPHHNADGETALERARRICAQQPAPTRPPTAREQFLFDWEMLLGQIVDRITEELMGLGYLTHIG